jgi:hypothetical protein
VPLQNVTLCATVLYNVLLHIHAYRLTVECDTLAAGRVTVASLTATAGVTAATVEATDITATGSLRAAKLSASALQLDGDADGGGYRLSNIALDRVSSLTGTFASACVAVNSLLW